MPKVEVGDLLEARHDRALSAAPVQSKRLMQSPGARPIGALIEKVRS